MHESLAQRPSNSSGIRRFGLKKAGRTYKEIAEITGVHGTTACKWYKAYLRGGKPAVTIKKRGRPKGSCRTLTQEQEKELQKAIRDKFPDQLKLAFALWTRIAVQQLIKQLWSMDMPIRTVGEYLNRWGFTPQKPLKKLTNKIPRLLKPGWKMNIRKLPSEQKKKARKFIGAMRPGCVTIATMGEVMLPVERHPKSSFIHDANESI